MEENQQAEQQAQEQHSQVEASPEVEVVEQQQVSEPEVIQQEKKMQVQEEASPPSEEKDHQEGGVQNELHQEMINRLGMLESKIKDYEAKEKENAARVVQEKLAARDKLLKDFGILDDLYGKLAPSIDEADPRTEAGQEVFRQWMTKHPSLFRKAPSIEGITNAAQENEIRGNSFRRHLTFSEAIRKIKG